MKTLLLSVLASAGLFLAGCNCGSSGCCGKECSKNPEACKACCKDKAAGTCCKGKADGATCSGGACAAPTAPAAK